MTKRWADAVYFTFRAMFCWLHKLVETSIKTLQNEKQIEAPSLQMATIKFTKNGDLVKTEYLVMLQPKNGGTTFTFSYKLNGDLIKMDY